MTYSKMGAAVLLTVVCAAAAAEPVRYEIDPSHTFPSFEADHMGGLSLWRGKFNEASGEVTMDVVKKTGTVDIVIQAASVDFGFDKMNEHAMNADMFDVEQFPTATYKGTLADFKKGAPTKVKGELTLKGVTKPVDLKITSFKCMMNPMAKREVCGADASATFNRADFGLDYGKAYGFKMDVTLRIQVEALRADASVP